MEIPTVDSIQQFQETWGQKSIWIVCGINYRIKVVATRRPWCRQWRWGPDTAPCWAPTEVRAAAEEPMEATVAMTIFPMTKAHHWLKTSTMEGKRERACRPRHSPTRRNLFVVQTRRRNHLIMFIVVSIGQTISRIEWSTCLWRPGGGGNGIKLHKVQLHFATEKNLRLQFNILYRNPSWLN